MSEHSDDRPSLRERKKAKTRAMIQQHALRLFRDQGYGATTVEQIADAAEISPSTFFRYFPTKEDVILNDVYDTRFIESLRAQPAALSPMQALRQAMQETLQAMSSADLALELARSRLLMEVPEVRGAYLNNIALSMRMVAAEVARRVGRATDDGAVLSFTGAVFGVCMAVSLRWLADAQLDFAKAVDEGLAHLAAGLPL